VQNPTLDAQNVTSEATQTAPEPPSKPSDEPSPVAVVWEHYDSVVLKPNKMRRALDDTQRRIIAAALKVRDVAECCCAIDGLAKSPHHNGQNDRGKKYLDLRFALRGNGQRGETAEQRIDNMCEIATQSDTVRRTNGLHLQHTAPDPSIYDKGIEDA
jgi:hypothetical protein